MTLPDIQQEVPKIRKMIHQVGVSDVMLPFHLLLRNGRTSAIQIYSKAEMVCELDKDTRGISMSRFVRSIQPFLELPLKRTTMEMILKKFIEIHNTNKVSLKMEFKLPIKKDSPISDNKFVQLYDCSFRCIYSNTSFQFFEAVKVQYASYCPCSESLCHEGIFGYPHAQRAYAEVLVRTDPLKYVWLENIIDIVENAVVNVPYPIIKRSDEKFIAGRAKNNTMFIEDAIRAISESLEKNHDILDWFVKCIHEESIHTSNAIAKNWKGVYGGFDETTYI